MVEHGNGFGFVDKPLDGAFVVLEFVAQNFDGDIAAGSQILGTQNIRHAADANDCFDFIAFIDNAID